MRTSYTALVAGAGLGWCLLCLMLSPVRAGVGENPDIETVYQFSLAPSGAVHAPDDTWILGVNQAEKPRLRAVRVSKSGEVTPFPDERMARGDPSGDKPPLDAVEALQIDGDGIVWMLDNGRRSEVPAKFIAWELKKQRVQRVLYLAPPAVVPGSFAADFVIDPSSTLIFVSDPANGGNAGLIVLDRTTNIARRVLQGHPSLVPDLTVPLRVTRTGKESKRLDGSPAVPHCGVRSLVIDRKSQWLYYAPVQSAAVYRLPVALLRDPKTPPEKLAAAVERYADKPAAASLAIDNKNNIYVGDIEGRAIGVIEAEHRQYRILAADARLVWPDGLCFGQDGKLYFFSRSQTAVAAPRDGVVPIVEHGMFRMKPLAAGTPGS